MVGVIDGSSISETDSSRSSAAAVTETTQDSYVGQVAAGFQGTGICWLDRYLGSCGNNSPVRRSSIPLVTFSSGSVAYSGRMVPASRSSLINTSITSAMCDFLKWSSSRAMISPLMCLASGEKTPFSYV